MDLQKYVTVDFYLPVDKCLHLINEGRCQDTCTLKACVYVCPAGVFELIDDMPVFHRERVCLECGACRLVCDNVMFDYPAVGGGVINHFG